MAPVKRKSPEPAVERARIGASPAAASDRGGVRDLPAGIRSLSRAAGNHAVTQVLNARRGLPNVTISQPSDRAEQEADRMADAVVSHAPVPAMSEGSPVNRNAGSRGREGDTRRALDAVDTPGAPLPEGVRGALEEPFGRDLSHVRIHTDAASAAAARGISARAYTVGSHIAFGPDGFRPAEPEGQRLIAHEVAHTLQPPGAAGVVLQRAPAEPATLQEPVAVEEDKRQSLYLGWYIETDPATPIITAGTRMRFRLRNSIGTTGFGWIPAPGSGAKPVFTVTGRSGRPQYFEPFGDESTPWIDFPAGHFRVTFRGTPFTGQGLINPGSEILVSLDLDVVGDVAPGTLAAPAVEASATSDVEHLEHPDAAEGEVAMAFERLAVRQGFAVLETNRREAEEQLAVYTNGTDGQPPAQAVEELKVIYDFDSAVQDEMTKLRSTPYEVIVTANMRGLGRTSVADIRAFIAEQEERVALGRQALVEAFPALAVVTRNPEMRRAFEDAPHLRQAIIQSGLRRVLKDIETTKRNLATGDLSILRIDPIVAETRRALGIDTDERRAKAVDQLVKAHHSEEMKTGLAVAGGSLFLLFVPGVGPYLAAVAGAGWAARSWVRVGELSAAAGSGVRGGLVSRQEVGAAGFWALLDTFFAGLDLGGALSAARQVAPHVPEVTARLARRSTKTVKEVLVHGGDEAAEVIEDLMPAAGKGETPFSISERNLQELLFRFFRRPLKPLSGHVHFFKTEKQFYAVWLWISKPKAMTVAEFLATRRPPIGFHYQGQVYLSPRAGLKTTIHEMVHKILYDTLPLGNQLLGKFVNEGITEWLTRSVVGPAARAHPYDLNVVFVEALQARLGPNTVASAVGHGNYIGLRNAVKTAMGGNELKTFQFMNRLRTLGGANGKPTQAALDEMLAMLESGGLKMKPPAPPAPPGLKPPRAKAAAEDLIDLEPGHLEGPYGVRPPGSESQYLTSDILDIIAEQTEKVPRGGLALAEEGVRSRVLRSWDQYHHLLVQELRFWFKKKGMKIDDYTVQLSADEHRWIHNEYEWNKLWKDYMRANRKATVEEIEAQMRLLQKKVGLEGLDVVPVPEEEEEIERTKMIRFRGPLFP